MDWTPKAVDSLNDAARQVHAAALTLFGVGGYVGTAAVATSHEVLLRDSHVTLPLLEVGVPQRWFYTLVPALVVVLHLNLLLQQYFLARKLRRLHPVLPKGDQAPDVFALSGPLQFFVARDISNEPWPVKGLLRLVLVFGNGLLPVGLLLVLQGRFLPYHPPWQVAAIQIAFLGFDLLVLAYLLPVTLARDGHWRTLWLDFGNGTWQRGRRVAVRVLVVVGFLSAAGFSATLANWRPNADCARPWWAEWFPPNLELRGRVLSAAPPAGRLAEPTVHRASSSGLHLAGRDLRCADLTGANLVAADLSGADLTAATMRKAILEGADLSGATLTAAVLSEARMAGADLIGAVASNADLTGAELIAARLVDVQLLGAEAAGADLLCANLDGAKLAGASFVRARLEAADLFANDMDLVDFGEAYLQGAVTPYWRATELRRARLGGSSALEPTAGDPRITFRDPQSDLTDYRLVDLAALPPEVWQELLDSQPGTWSERRVDVLAGLQRGSPELHAACVERLKRAAESQETRLPANVGRVLYSTTSPPHPGWPQPLDEASFRIILHDVLLERACRDSPFAVALARRAARRVTASDPDHMAAIAATILERRRLARPCPGLAALPADLIGDLQYAALGPPSAPPRWTRP